MKETGDKTNNKANDNDTKEVETKWHVTSQSSLTLKVDLPARERLSDYCDTPWVEKYRPVSLNDCIGEVVGYFKAFVKTGSFPLACILHGDYGCHSEDTKVLTPNGIMDWRELNVGDFVYGADNSMNLVETTIEDIYQYQYEGSLLHFHSDRYDLLITPNHRIMTRPKDSKPEDGYIYHRADKQFAKESYFPMPFNWNGRQQNTFDIHEYVVRRPKRNNAKDRLPVLPTNDFMRLIGWYISEGNPFRTRRGTYIQIRAFTYKDEVKQLLTRLNLDFSVYDEGTRFVIFHRDLADYCERCGTSCERKTIPLEILNLAREHLLCMFETIMKGDGHRNGYYYYTTSKELAERFLILLLKIGLYGKYSEHKPKAGGLNKQGQRIVGKLSSYIINVAYDAHGWFYRKRNLTEEQYKGTVWCFKTVAGNFITVRDGRMVISGNSGKTSIVKAAVRDYFVLRGLFRRDATFFDITHASKVTREYNGIFAPALFIDTTVVKSGAFSAEEVIRTRVQNFMQYSVGKWPKFIVFDESDRLGHNCQEVCTSLIEKYPRTRTLWTLNDLDNIMDRIVSRAAGGVFEVKKPAPKLIVPRLRHIAQWEKVRIPEDKIREIAKTAPSVRDAVGLLQQQCVLVKATRGRRR